MLFVPVAAVAQQSPTAPQPFVEPQRQQERERALRQQNECAVDECLQVAPAPPATRIPESEAPCFRIDRVLLVGEQANAFQWAVSDPEGNAAVNASPALKPDRPTRGGQ